MRLAFRTTSFLASRRPFSSFSLLVERLAPVHNVSPDDLTRLVDEFRTVSSALSIVEDATMTRILGSARYFVPLVAPDGEQQEGVMSLVTDFGRVVPIFTNKEEAQSIVEANIDAMISIVPASSEKVLQLMDSVSLKDDSLKYLTINNAITFEWRSFRGKWNDAMVQNFALTKLREAKDEYEVDQALAIIQQQGTKLFVPVEVDTETSTDDDALSMFLLRELYLRLGTVRFPPPKFEMKEMMASFMKDAAESRWIELFYDYADDGSFKKLLIDNERMLRISNLSQQTFQRDAEAFMNRQL